MTDFHSHILPRMDDGSKSVEESLKMLEILASQGVKRVVATPHFYANRESVEEFLARRDESYKLLKAEMNEGMPEIVLGAEVKFYDGIIRLQGIEKLCIQGSEILLLEMPFTVWSQSVLNQLLNMSASGEYIVALAHIERYPSLKRHDILETLLQNDIIMQVNARFVIRFSTRARAFRMFKRGYIQLLGSDCHNLTDRSPDIGTAAEIISKKISKELIMYINDYADSLFEQTVNIN